MLPPNSAQAGNSDNRPGQRVLVVNAQKTVVTRKGDILKRGCIQSHGVGSIYSIGRHEDLTWLNDSLQGTIEGTNRAL